MNSLSLVVAGLESGSLYALMALGLVLIYKVQDLVNFAQGEVYMAGAFVGFMAYQDAHWPYPVSLIAAVLAGAVLGIIVERAVIRPIAWHPHATLAMATVGVSVALRGAARLPFGADIYAFPPLLAGPPITLGPILITRQSAATLLIALSLTAAIFVLLQFTRAGRQIRATQQNAIGARVVGINVGRVHSLTWALACAVGAAAGVLAAPITLLYPDMGSSMLIKGFAAAVLGGFGNVAGAIVGGFGIGIIEKLVGGLVSTSLIEVSAYLVIIIVMFVRPSGLLGRSLVKRV